MKYGRILLILATICCLHLVEANKEAMRQTMPAYAMSLVSDMLNGTTCGKQLEEFRDAVEKRILWAVNMLDASGGPKSGFIDGNNYWLGSRGACQHLSNKDDLPLSKHRKLNNSRYRNPQEEYPPFPLHYFVTHLEHNSTLQKHAEILGESIISMGLCLPDSCSTDEIRVLVERIINDETLVFGHLFLMSLKLAEVKDLRDDHLWLLEPRYIIILSLLILSVLFTVAGTIYDVCVHQRRLKEKQKLLTCENNNTAEEKQEEVRCEVANIEPRTRLQKFLMCYSMYTNTKQIVCTNANSDNIAMIHGLRFFGMCWIVLVHTFFYGLDFAENRAWEFRISKEFFNQVIGNATYSVDTFFFLSGFLLSYSFYKAERKKKKEDTASFAEIVRDYFELLLKRFVRLTPAYMMIVGITQLNWGFYDKVSMFHMTEKPHEVCAKYWWRNLLYINNLFSRHTMCLSWSWYLSNDMQFFVVGLMLLMLSRKHFTLAATILVSMLAGSVILTGIVSYSYEYIPTLDEQYNLLNILYDPPWIRIGPYIVGMIMGYVMLNINGKVKIDKKVLAVCWFLGMAGLVVVLFGTYFKEMPLWMATLYSAFSRPLWGASIAWLLFACLTKNGGIVNTILAFKGWIPLSKLTYCVYLINPMVIASIYMGGESSIHLNVLQAVAQCSGMTVASYGAAYILTLLLEIPYILLVRIFLVSRTKNM